MFGTLISSFVFRRRSSSWRRISPSWWVTPHEILNINFKLLQLPDGIIQLQPCLKETKLEWSSAKHPAPPSSCNTRNAPRWSDLRFLCPGRWKFRQTQPNITYTNININARQSNSHCFDCCFRWFHHSKSHYQSVSSPPKKFRVDGDNFMDFDSHPIDGSECGRDLQRFGLGSISSEIGSLLWSLIMLIYDFIMFYNAYNFI